MKRNLSDKKGGLIVLSFNFAFMIHQRFILILALVYSTTVFSQDAIQNVFSIKKQPAKTHLIETFSDYLGNETTLPIAIFQGKEDGPIVTIVAGIHGFEYPPIVATQELMQEIDPERLRGNTSFYSNRQ